MLIFTDLAGGSQFSTLFLVYLTATELRKKIEAKNKSKTIKQGFT
jgi:hypothetical protein